VIKGFREKWAWKEREWSVITEDTGTGNPKKSTSEKGRKFFEDVTDKISELIQDICKANPDEIYK
jgi:creatinine amidohydrolase